MTKRLRYMRVVKRGAGVDVIVHYLDDGRQRRVKKHQLKLVDGKPPPLVGLPDFLPE